MPRSPEKYREYMKAYMLKRYKRRRAEAIQQLGGQCVRCGETDPEILNFDHREQKKLTGAPPIAKLLAGASAAKLKAELAKCQLLCLDCHHSKSVWEADRRPSFGLPWAQDRHGSILGPRPEGDESEKPM